MNNVTYKSNLFLRIYKNLFSFMNNYFQIDNVLLFDTNTENIKINSIVIKNNTISSILIITFN